MKKLTNLESFKSSKITKNSMIGVVGGQTRMIRVNGRMVDKVFRHDPVWHA